MIKGGYMGKILRVDLSKDVIEEERLPEESELRKYIGCVGLGMKYLYDEVKPNVQPLNPANRLIFMTGPLTGTIIPAASNWSIVTLNYNTGYTAGTAHSHGMWGAFLKFSGFDGIIVQGASKRPVSLHIKDGRAELRDASNIWGKDTHETEDLLMEEIGDKELSIACIGPAGENLCRGALISNDKNHCGAKGGVGAVMGSKKLKAIAIYGKKRSVTLAHPKEVLDISLNWRSHIFEFERNAAVRLKNGGITRSYHTLAEDCRLAGKNMTTTAFGVEYAKNFEELASLSLIRPKACFACPIACAYDITIGGEGPYRGQKFTMGGGGENTEGAAAMIGVLDAGAAFWLTDLYDKLGFDAGTGCAISFAYECYEKGILTKKDTDGLELKWGNAEAAATLLKKMIKQEGFGKVLAQGPKKAAEIIGGEAPKFAVHVKGTGWNVHDWRVSWQVVLGQAVAGAGPCHQGLGADVVVKEPDIGYEKLSTPFDPKETPKAVVKTQIKKLWEDCIGICWFVALGVPGVTEFSHKALSATVGWDFTLEEALSVGERVINLQRLFNMKRGLSFSHDIDVSPRILEAPPDGKAKGRPIGPHLEKMVKTYYGLMGWDKKDGRPLRKTLKRLGLDH